MTKFKSLMSLSTRKIETSHLGSLVEILERTSTLYEYFVLIHNLSASKVLLVPSDNGWSLPHFQPKDHRFWQNVGEVSSIINDDFGIRVITLRCLYSRFDENLDTVLNAYITVAIDTEYETDNSLVWINVQDIHQVEMTLKSKEIIKKWLEWLEIVNLSGSSTPWFTPNWYKTMEGWIYSELERLGVKAISSIQQIRSWQLSSIMTLKTTAGDVFFKAVPKFLSHEISVTNALAKQYPAYFPLLLSSDDKRGWMLTLKAGEITLDNIHDIESWIEALQVFAKIQIDQVHQIDLLKSLGCPLRELNGLGFFLRDILTDGEIFLKELVANHLSATEHQILLNSLPKFHCVVEKLLNYNIPLSLEHGDFWSNQIVLREGMPVYLDWSHASITHPFFSAIGFLAQIEKQLPQYPDARARLQSAYLEPWTQYESAERLATAFELCQPVARLHYTHSYYEIVRQNQIKWELQSWIPRYLKRFISLIQGFDC